MFHFKKFSISQENSAMKVGTDGVLLGAWADFPLAGNILDVGTGTGLLSLMAAQRTQAKIHAIEICPNASKDAALNFTNSDWNSRLSFRNISLKDFYEINSLTFDYIVCNPPFYNSTYLPDDNSRAWARQNQALKIEDLFRISNELLSENGKISVIFPETGFNENLKIAENTGFFPVRITYVKPNISKPVKRVLFEAGKARTVFSENSISIETDKRHEYSPEYIELTKDFYMKM